MRPYRFGISVATGTAVVALSLGIAGAEMPGRYGDINGCYSTTTGALRVIDYPRAHCASGEKSIRWNQYGQPGAPAPSGSPGGGSSVGSQGPAGPAGPQAIAGPHGIQGPTGPSTLSALRGSPCSADGSSGIVAVTTGSGGASVPITLSCTKTPTVTATVAGGTMDLIDLGEALHDDQYCRSATSCVRVFEYGHWFFLALVNSQPFHVTCNGQTSPAIYNGTEYREPPICSITSLTSDDAIGISIP